MTSHVEQVLDHGFVRLVDFMGNDTSVVRAARVSYDAAWRAGENEGSDYRLIHYLWKHKHTSPFESVEFQFEVKGPMFMLEQWLRHRTWSFNKVSGRYRELLEEFYLPKAEVIGEQSKNNKQGRQASPIERDEEVAILRRACLASFETYRFLLGQGWPKELARAVLPASTYSHMFAKVDLLNLFKFLTLRCDAHAQWEIRQYANAIRELIRPIVPVCVAAWESDGRP